MYRIPKAPLGYFDRGMKMPAYPTPAQAGEIGRLQPSLRAAWNWMVHRVEEPLRAKEAKAVREGLLEPVPPRPDFRRDSFEEYLQAKADYAAKIADRNKRLYQLPIEVQWRPWLSGKDSEAQRLGLKHGYQVINNYLVSKDLPVLRANVIMAMERNFAFKAKGQKKKRYRRDWEVMPIQVYSGRHMRLRVTKPEDSWEIRRCNAEVDLPGVGWIAVYLHSKLMNYWLTPGNYLREGCTLKFECGRWYASVKIVRREELHPGPQDGSVCGIDPGLDKLMTVSDGTILKNPRNLKYAKSRELALSIADKVPDKECRSEMRFQIFRIDGKVRRRLHTQMRQLIARLSNEYDFIGIERNEGKATGQYTRFTGCTKVFIRYMTYRCGTNRVREINSNFNSQTCSKCGHRDKEAWSRKDSSHHDQSCKCLKCGYTADRDLNAAVNVRNKTYELLYKDLFPAGE